MLKAILTFRKNLKKVFILFVVSFLAVFFARFIYEVYFADKDILINYSSNYMSSSPKPESERAYVNVATDKIVQKDTTGQSVTIDQKYEKTANMASTSVNFQADNNTIRKEIENFEAVIQSENLTGLKGSLQLAISIGVKPDKFDLLVEKIKSIGSVKSFEVNKVDKTNEYRNLMAEIDTLQKTKESYKTIKEKGGSIQDLLMLEEKILEVEKSLQSLGVGMGLYSSANSLCTINLTLAETALTTISLKFILRSAKMSLYWTMGAFALIVFMLLTALICFWILFAILNNMQKMAELAEKNKDNKLDKSENGKE